MPVALFLCPMVGTGTRGDPRRGKYSRVAGMVSSDTKAFSRFGHALVRLDAPQRALNEIARDSDCFVFGSPDGVVDKTERDALVSYLEARGIPGEWLAEGLTRGEVVQRLYRVSQAMRSLEWQWKEPIAARLQKEPASREVLTRAVDDGLRR